jgi:uncharacterized protein YbdZ (MbtH family)
MEDKDIEAVAAHIEKATNVTDDAAERGRLIQEQERQLSLWATVKLHPRAVLACTSHPSFSEDGAKYTQVAWLLLQARCLDTIKSPTALRLRCLHS